MHLAVGIMKEKSDSDMITELLFPLRRGGDTRTRDNQKQALSYAAPSSNECQKLKILTLLLDRLRANINTRYKIDQTLYAPAEILDAIELLLIKEEAKLSKD